MSVPLGRDCTSVSLERIINVFSVFSLTKSKKKKKISLPVNFLSLIFSPAPISAEVSQGPSTPTSEILDQLIHFLKAMLDVHWAVLLFFALNPAPLPSLLSKGEEHVAESASDRPADRPLMYLDCGWSKVNWGRGMYSPVRGECLAAVGERECV